MVRYRENDAVLGRCENISILEGWKQKAVLLKEESIARANARLKTRADRTDFSDLMQALLEAWLQTSE